MKKILVIEDELLLRKGVSEILGFEGYEVFDAENGQAGIQASLEFKPDLILCDIMMPVMDGYEVLRRLRQIEQTQIIPFIFMTALADRSDLRTGMELGSDDYITKPFTRDELLNSISARFKKSDEITKLKEGSLNELRTNIIGHMPHELITPLNAILCYGEYLKDYSNSVTTQELTEIGSHIFESGTRLHRLIENYLLYAQLEIFDSSSTEIKRIEDPHIICESKIKEVAAGYERLKDLKLTISGGTALMGKDDLSKIIFELTDNAFKFSEIGSPVKVTCEPSGCKYKITIVDSGRGMTISDIPNIGAFMQFDRKFYEQQGSGLGLIITKKVIEKYNGTLTIESDQEKGSTVIVLLPS